jgi:hypothetical protein
LQRILRPKRARRAEAFSIASLPVSDGVRALLLKIQCDRRALASITPAVDNQPAQQCRPLDINAAFSPPT